MNQVSINNQNEISQNSLVSVIVPFLNTQKYIQESIESVLAQTYPHWELLLIDDGSNDGSTEIAQKFSQQYPQKIHYLEHEGHQNRGASASRNLGLRSAKGKYIAFLDGDDVWLASNLEHFVNILEVQPEAAMVYGPTQWWYSWTGKPEDRDRDFVWELSGAQMNTVIEPPHLFAPLFLYQTATIPCTCSLLVRREVIETIGGFENKFRYIYTDQVLYAKLFLKASVIVTNECGAKYRQHPNSSCAIVEKAGQLNTARLKFLTWLEEYLLEQGIQDAQTWQALKKQIRFYRSPRLHQVLTQVEHRLNQATTLAKAIARRTLPRRIRQRLRNQH